MDGARRGQDGEGGVSGPRGDSTDSGGGIQRDPVEPTFGLDDLVGGRYRIRRFLGQGATGEVYAASDLHLGTEVALKVLKRGAGSSESPGIERFKREILLARRVSHPNVCRIFDLGVHLLAPREGLFRSRPAADGEAGAGEGSGATAARATEPVLFLTMELLDGRTLVRRIDEDGPYDEKGALPIVRQLADGLAAAHRAGVVHRDFKSSNILLVPDEDGTERAVITDFGLARDQRVPSGASALTATGGVLGTPAYMAPEQVEGRRATARSDLYAFGIVLYEMFTGRLPFEGESPLSVAVKRLREPPTPIESLRPDLSGRCRAVVRRCLERAPADRFDDALEIPRALDGELRALAPRRVRRRFVAALVATLALAGGWAVWRARGRVAGGEAAAVHADRSAVAVLALRNASGRPDAAWLSAGLAEMLSTELGASRTLRAVPGETVARASADLGLAPTDSLAAATLAKLHRAAGADWVLVGSYAALGPEAGDGLRLDLRLQPCEPGAGRRDLPLSVTGREGELFDLVARAGRELRQALGAGEPGPEAGEPARAAMPHSADAVRLYTEGLERLRAYEPLAARERLEAAVAADPEAPLAWSALARAWTDLGYSDRAREAARTAFEKSSALPRPDALLVEARFRLASSDWNAAVEDFRALWRFFPDDLEHGLNLVDALIEAGRSAEAITTLDELRALPEPARDDPRIDLDEARAAEGLSDFRRELTAAKRAAAKAVATGSKSLQARALYEQGIAERKLGAAEASRAALLEARRVSAEAGDRGGVALSLMALANLERAQGKLDEAAALFAEARTTFASLGNRDREARAELSQGLVLSQQGDLPGALAHYETALAVLRDVGDRRAAAAALANIGTMRYELGDLDGALARHTEAIAEFRALGDESRVVVALANIAEIRQDRGELDAAAEALDQELAIARRIADRAGEGYALKAQGDLAAERGDTKAARERYAEARKVFADAGQEGWRRLTELGAATLDLDFGHPERAEPELARLAEEFGRAGMASDQDEAAVQRVRALVALGHLDAAADAARGLLARAEKADGRRLRHLGRLADAELAAARGDVAGARRTLEADLADGAKAGLLIQGLETRAALARVERAAGDPQAVARAMKLAGEVAAEAGRVGSGRVLSELGDLAPRPRS